MYMRARAAHPGPPSVGKVFSLPQSLSRRAFIESFRNLQGSFLIQGRLNFEDPFSKARASKASQLLLSFQGLCRFRQCAATHHSYHPASQEVSLTSAAWGSTLPTPPCETEMQHATRVSRLSAYIVHNGNFSGMPRHTTHTPCRAEKLSFLLACGRTLPMPLRRATNSI